MMNWVDLLIIVTLLLFALESFGKPFILEVLDLLGFMLAFLFSLEFYNPVAKLFGTQFQLPHSLANVLGFILIWCLVEMIFSLLYQMVLFKKKFSQRLLPTSYLSFIPGFFRGLVSTTIILIILATFPIQPQIKLAIENSKIGSAILSQSYQLETPLKSVFGGLANNTLSFLTVEPKTGESVNLGFTTDKFTFDGQQETAMIGLVNSDRLSRGFKALKYNQSLQQIARSHSADMFERGYFSHYSPEGKTVADRANSANIAYLVIGENLAYAPNLTVAHDGLMNSPGHRANILSPDFNQFGIGIANSDVYGLMITQVFTN